MAIGPISREQAEAIVRTYLATDGHQLTGRTVAKVISISELLGREPFVYDIRIPLAECWIAYLVPRLPNLIASSDIVLVSRDGGKIVYTGSANDEG